MRQSGVPPYDRRINSGYWRTLLYRESKKTRQVLISVVVSEKYPIETEKQEWIKNELIS